MELTQVRFKKILYATDLSETAVHAFSYAVSLSNMYGASITILHVLAEFPGEQFITNMINTTTWEEIKNRHYSEARDKLIGKRRDHVAMKEVLEAFSEAVKTNGEAQAFDTDEILIKHGTPAEVILEAVETQKYDLVVMGTHGQGVIADVLVGSTARRVIKNSPIPVMVIRLP